MLNFQRALAAVLLASLVLVGPLPARASATGGVVTMKHPSCDYFLVHTKRGYVVFEWFSGADPDEQDLLVGSDTSFYTYGFHDIYDKTQRRGVHVYVEDYDVDEDEGIDKLNEECQ